MCSLFKEIRIFEKVDVNYLTHGESKALEQFIATDAWSSFGYANNVIGGRFEFGEGVIASHAWCSYFYAYYVIGERFELGEEAIFEDENIKQRYQEFLETL